MKTYNTHRKNISWDRLIFVNIGIALSLLFLSCCFGPAYWPLGPAYKIGRNVVNGSENLKINYEKLSQIPLEEVALLGVPRPLRLVIREMPWGGGEWGKRYKSIYATMEKNFVNMKWTKRIGFDVVNIDGNLITFKFKEE